MDELVRRVEFQDTLRREIARSERYRHGFAIVQLEARRNVETMPLQRKMAEGLRVLRQTIRTSDVAYKVYEDTLVAILVETDAPNSQAAIHRVASRLASATGGWTLTLLHFPEHRAQIEALPALLAA